MHERTKYLLITCTIFALYACNSSASPDASLDGGETRVRCTGTDDGYCPCHTSVNGDTRYLLCPATVTWATARENCRRFGYELVRIDDEAEQNAVWAAAAALGGDYWIGLNDDGAEGVWEWSDGTPLGTYQNWEPGQPDGTSDREEDCVEILEMVDGRWNDRDCSTDYLDYICEGPI